MRRPDFPFCIKIVAFNLVNIQIYSHIDELTVIVDFKRGDILIKFTFVGFLDKLRLFEFKSP